jgi:protein SCO1
MNIFRMVSRSKQFPSWNRRSGGAINRLEKAQMGWSGRRNSAAMTTPASPFGKPLRCPFRPVHFKERLLVLLALFVMVSPVRGQNPSAILTEIGVDQKLNEQVPLNLAFRDEQGRTVSLSSYFHGKPVILSLVYYECPMLCGMALNGLLKSLRALPLDVGTDFEVVTVSFDPSEQPPLAATKRDIYTAEYGRAGGRAGWHFLTGDVESIRQLTEAVGFRYKFDTYSKQWAHTTAIMVLTPEGRVSQYFYGLEYSARDLRLGLVQASQNKIGSLVDRILLYCYHYDPSTGRYGIVIMNALRLAAGATLAGLLGFIIVAVRRDRRATQVRC